MNVEIDDALCPSNARSDIRGLLATLEMLLEVGFRLWQKLDRLWPLFPQIQPPSGHWMNNKTLGDQRCSLQKGAIKLNFN